MRISLPKNDWEIIASACIQAGENPKYLSEKEMETLRTFYFEIRYRIKNGIKG